jgi:general stress protein 26
MPEKEPMPYFDGSFSSPGTKATPWSDARTALDEAEVFWLSTVRRDRRPHVTPLLGVWMGDSLYFCTGPDERKAKNLKLNMHCILTTGHNTLRGLDLVLEGDATEVTDEAERGSVADRFESKYGSHFAAPEGTWSGLGDAMRRGDALLYRVAPSRVFGFRKGGPYSQTRWDFA